MSASNPTQAKGGYLWYLVIAKRGRETLAKQNLERQGFHTYLPMHAPGAGIPRPFLPGYLFVAVDLSEPGWRSLYSTYGVQSIYTTGSGEAARPRAIPNGWIEDLQIREVNGLIVLKPREPDLPIEPGSPVHLYRGSASIDALFLERVDAKRVAILVSLLGRDSRQVVTIDDIAELRNTRTSRRGSVR